MNKAKSIPMRTCLATRKKYPKNELIRIVKDIKDNVLVDEFGKISGKGVYLKKDIETIEKAKKRKTLENQFEVKITEDFYKELLNIVKP